MSVYFDVVINKDNNSFYIIDSQTKPKNYDSAFVTLNKIGFILANNFKYKSNGNGDDYSQKTSQELLEILKSKSLYIHSKYDSKYQEISNKEQTLIDRVKSFFSKKTEIDEMNSKIQKFTPPDPNLLLNGMDREAREIAKKASLLGYKEAPDDRVVEEIREMYSALDFLISNDVIPKEYLVYTKDGSNKLDRDGTLLKLKYLPLKELLPILFHPLMFHSFANSWAPFRLLFSTKNNKWDESYALGPEDLYHANTIFRDAINQGLSNICDLMLKIGANIDAVDCYTGKTSLHESVLWKNKSKVEFLVGRGADVNRLDFKGFTPFMYACDSDKRNSIEIMELLLKSGKVDQKNKNRAFLDSVKRGNLEQVKILLEHKANINTKDINDTTALSWAQTKNPELADYLRNNGANT